MKVSVQAICIVKEGYGYQGLMSAVSLAEVGHDVTLVSAREYGVDSVLHPTAQRCFQQHLPTEKQDVDLAVTLPVKFINTQKSQVRMLHAIPTTVRAIEAVWEASRIPKIWVEAFNTMNCDLIVVPHAFSKEVFIDSGVTKSIEVLPSGVDKEKRTPVVRTRGDKFRFLMVGRLEPRKNGQCAIEAFKRAFPNNHEYRDVNLCIKTRPDAIPPEILRAVRLDPRIQILTRDVPEDKLTQLYYQCHCFVYPSRGEGFSYTPRDAIATGMPTIVTGWSAMRDIPGAIQIPVSKFSPMFPNPFSGGEEKHMLMADPDPDILAALMRSVYDDYDKHVAECIEHGQDELSWKDYPVEFERVFRPWL